METSEEPTVQEWAVTEHLLRVLNQPTRETASCITVFKTLTIKLTEEGRTLKWLMINRSWLEAKRQQMLT